MSHQSPSASGCSGCSQCTQKGACQSGGCAGCCAGSRNLVLCQDEALLLLTLGQLAFLPVMWKPGEEDLLFAPLAGYGVESLPQFSDLVRSLRNKGLISREIDAPLQGASYPAQSSEQQRPGSLALTALGQEAVGWLERFLPLSKDSLPLQ